MFDYASLHASVSGVLKRPILLCFCRDDTYSTSTGEFIPGNGGSLHLCRRRWDLADANYLKYQYLNAFDRAMMHLDKAFGFVAAPHTWVSRKVSPSC